MSEVLNAIQDRITTIDCKISANANVMDYVEELDFLKGLLCKLMMHDDGADQPKNMPAGVIGDILGQYPRETPVFIYNCAPGDDSLHRFSQLSSFQFNEEKGAVELFYDDNYSYEDY